MEKITLSKSGGLWVARHTSPEVRALFGTDTLPTPFGRETASQVVRARIEALNPGVRVVVDEPTVCNWCGDLLPCEWHGDGRGPLFEPGDGPADMTLGAF